MNVSSAVIPAKAGTQTVDENSPAKPGQIDQGRLRRELQARMAAAELSQSQLADRTGGEVNQSTLSKFLAGKLDRLGLENIEAIAAALGCARHDLTGEPPVQAGGVGQMIEAARLMPNPRNYRRVMDADALDGLLASIVQVGVLQNLLVRPDGMDGFFVVAGHRRLAAVKLGQERGELPASYALPCRVIDATDAEALTEALIENLHREDVHALDEARAFEELQELNGCDSERVAGMVGKNPRYVQYRLRLLEALSPKIIEAFRDDKISFTQARELCAADHDVQETVIERIGSGWYRTTDELARAVKTLQDTKEKLEEAKKNPPPASKREPSVPLLSNEERAARKEAIEKEQAIARDTMASKARTFNTLFRSALRGRPGTIARNALMDIMLRPETKNIRSNVLGDLHKGQEAAFCGLLGVDPPPAADAERPDGTEDNWLVRAAEAIRALDDTRATEILLLTIAATAQPARLISHWQGSDVETWATVYSYDAWVESPAARSLAAFLGVYIPDDMVPPPPPTAPEAGEIDDGEDDDDDGDAGGDDDNAQDDDEVRA